MLVKQKKGDLDDGKFVLYLTIGISVTELVKATSLKDGQQTYGIRIHILKKATFSFFIPPYLLKLSQIFHHP